METCKKDASKPLSCLFLLDVLCSYRKTEQFAIMVRCLKCEHYVRFMREMDEEDKASDDFALWALANPEAYLRGEQP
jgi:hypothetical protein